MPSDWGDSLDDVEVDADPHPASPGRPKPLPRIALFAAIVALLFSSGWLVGRIRKSEPVVRGVVPADFEHHEAMILAWPIAEPSQKPVVVDIAKAIHHSIEVIVLVKGGEETVEAAVAFDQAGIDTDHVRFIELPVEVVWARDFGPLGLKSFGGEFEFVDAKYIDRVVPEHDEIPSRLARQFQFHVSQLPLIVEGGNLLSNGAGLCVTTERVLWDNADEGLTARQVTDLLREHLGARQIVYLEPLEDEFTKHVDMFATFTAPDTIVIGQYSANDDPVNAEILDRNAERLSSVVTASGPLRVERIPMPRRVDNQWFTYTNVVYANGVLLVPAYPQANARDDAAAVAVYKRLLPGWRIVRIDGTDLIKRNGSLHCATMNLYRTH